MYTKTQIIIFALYTLLFSQWQQDEFVIASFGDPTLQGPGNEAGDRQTLQYFKDAGFNTLTGYNHQPLTYSSLGTTSDNRIRYKLEIMDDVGDLKLLAFDQRLISTANPPVAVINEYLGTGGTNPLPSNLQNLIMGFSLGDEPHRWNNSTCTTDPRWTQTMSALQVFKNNAPDKLCYFNQTSHEIQPMGCGITGLEEFSENNNADVFVYDEYIFTENATGGIGIRPNSVLIDPNERATYFDSHLRSITNTMANNKAWWLTALSVQHDRNGSNCASTNMTLINSEAQMRFQAYGSLLYGAKGITWFTYCEQPSNYATDCWDYHPAFTDVNGNLNSTNTSIPAADRVATTTRPVYDWGSSINLVLKNLGPIMMNSKWIDAVHGNATCPMLDERNLNTVSATTPIISGISGTDSDFAAVGILNDNMKYYLLVLNKDISNSRSFQISLRNTPQSIKQHRKNTNGWNTLTTSGTIYVNNILPGDIQVFELEFTQRNLNSCQDEFIDPNKSFVADFNEDGLDDIAYFCNSGVQFYYADTDQRFSQIPSATLNAFGCNRGWDLDTHHVTLADLDGDGRKNDFVAFGSNAIWTATNSAGTFNVRNSLNNLFCSIYGWHEDHSPRLVGDINGDGFDDIVGFNHNGTCVAIWDESTGTFNYLGRLIDNYGTAEGWTVGTHKRMLANIDGDDALELVCIGGPSIFVADWNNNTLENLGAVNNNLMTSSVGWNETTHPRIMGDVTGDGREEIVGFGSSTIYVARWNSVDEQFELLGNGTYGLGSNQGWNQSSHIRKLANFDDIAGDEIIAIGSSGIVIGKWNGSGFDIQEIQEGLGTSNGWLLDNHVRLLGDINNDGRVDIIKVDNSNSITTLKSNAISAIRLWNNSMFY